MPKTQNIAIAIASLMIGTIGFAAPPPGKGGGNGGGGGGEEPPSVPFEPAYVYTLSGKPSTLNLANSDFSVTKIITETSDGRTRGLDHAPDEGRVLVEEFRALYETNCSVSQDGIVTLTGRTLLFDGESSASNLQCIATAANGATAYSLTSAIGGELKVKMSNGQQRSINDVGVLESCDFFSNGSSIAAIENLPGGGGHALLRFDVDIGAVTVTSLMFAPEEQFSIDEVYVAQDGQSFLLSWSDRRTGQSVRKVSEWRPGEVLTNNPVIATNALHASFVCDRNGNGLTDDGYVYQSTEGREPAWIEVTSAGTTELIASKGNKGIYWLRPTC